ncbi:MAG: hypothetical protein H6717_32255 [Polyangiaceae bacterium]|nr:hypothetical protein [Polyangiaceae bacterium]
MRGRTAPAPPHGAARADRSVRAAGAAAPPAPPAAAEATGTPVASATTSVLVKDGTHGSFRLGGTPATDVAGRAALLARAPGAARVIAELPTAELWLWVPDVALTRVTTGATPIDGVDGSKNVGTLGGGIAVDVIDTRGGRVHVRTKLYFGSNTLSLDATLPASAVGTEYVVSAPPRQSPDTHDIEFPGADYDKAPLAVLTHPGGVPVATLEQGGRVFGWSARLIEKKGDRAKVSVSMEDDDGYWVTVQGFIPARTLHPTPPPEAELDKVAEVVGGAAPEGAPAGSCLLDAPDGTPVGKLTHATAVDDEGRVQLSGLTLWVRRDGPCTP